MQLLAVDNEKANEAFFKVSAIIYKNDKNYIPHIRQDIEKIFNPLKNRLFKQGGQAQRWILYDDTGRLIGRIAAFIHPKTSKGKHKVGGMGFFDCINSKEAAFLLFDKCKSWLIERGMDGMDGPVNFGERDQFWGLLIHNFTSPPSYGMNYNPPYYQEFFEEYGFKNYFNQYVYWRDLLIPAQEVFVKKAGMAGLDKSFRCTHMRGVSHEKMAEYFLEVYNSAWGGHSGFKAMRLEQARNIIKSMKMIMDRDILLFAFIGEKPVGFYLSIPELNEFFRHVKGNLNWWGKLVFLYHLKFSRRKTMLGIVFGVSREYHGRGIEAALIKYCEEYVVPKMRYTETVLTWIGDFNPKMIKVIQSLGTILYRTLVTYRVFFDPSIPFERHAVIGKHSSQEDEEN